MTVCLPSESSVPGTRTESSPWSDEWVLVLVPPVVHRPVSVPTRSPSSRRCVPRTLQGTPIVGRDRGVRLRRQFTSRGAGPGWVTTATVRTRHFHRGPPPETGSQSRVDGPRESVFQSEKVGRDGTDHFPSEGDLTPPWVRGVVLRRAVTPRPSPAAPESDTETVIAPRPVPVLSWSGRRRPQVVHVVSTRDARVGTPWTEIQSDTS